MDHTLRQILLEIEGYLENELHVEIPTKQFKSDILVDYYYYPQDFMNFTEEEQEEVNDCLKQAGYVECHDALADFMQKANIALLDKDQFTDDNNYTFMVIECTIAPFLKEHQKFLRQETMVFICAPYIDGDEQQQFKVFLTTPTTGNLFLQLKRSRKISAEEQRDIEKRYWELFEQSVIEVHQSLYLAPVDLVANDEYCLEEFITLAGIDDRESFKTQYYLIQHDPEQFIRQLKEEGFYGEPSRSFLYYRFLLEDYSYFAYWELDYEAIADYIAALIGQDFSLDEEQSRQLSDIAEKLQQESDFTLLSIDTEFFDGEGLFVCRKENVEAILRLAKQLGFPINAL